VIPGRFIVVGNRLYDLLQLVCEITDIVQLQ
jgi:hypothetical protein